MNLPLYVSNLRRDVRFLRIHNDQLQRSQRLQKSKADEFIEELREKDKAIAELKKEKEKLEKELEKVKRERDSYKGLVFKQKRSCLSPSSHTPSSRKRGGQLGHPGSSRTKPENIDTHIHAYLALCPDCGNPLDRANSATYHTVVDLPHWSLMKPITTEYEIERQWCSHCHKEARAQPSGVIPGSRLGMNLLVMVMVWHYRFRTPFAKITELLSVSYGIHVSEGTIVSLLKKASDWLGKAYDKLIADIRAAPVKACR